MRLTLDVIRLQMLRKRHQIILILSISFVTAENHELLRPIWVLGGEIAKVGTTTFPKAKCAASAFRFLGLRMICQRKSTSLKLCKSEDLELRQILRLGVCKNRVAHPSPLSGSQKYMTLGSFYWKNEYNLCRLSSFNSGYHFHKRDWWKSWGQCYCHKNLAKAKQIANRIQHLCMKLLCSVLCLRAIYNITSLDACWEQLLIAQCCSNSHGWVWKTRFVFKVLNTHWLETATQLTWTLQHPYQFLFRHTTKMNVAAGCIIWLHPTKTALMPWLPICLQLSGSCWCNAFDNPNLFTKFIHES